MQQTQITAMGKCKQFLLTSVGLCSIRNRINTEYSLVPHYFSETWCILNFINGYTLSKCLRKAPRKHSCRKRYYIKWYKWEQWVKWAKWYPKARRWNEPGKNFRFSSLQTTALTGNKQNWYSIAISHQLNWKQVIYTTRRKPQIFMKIKANNGKDNNEGEREKSEDCAFGPRKWIMTVESWGEKIADTSNYTTGRRDKVPTDWLLWQRRQIHWWREGEKNTAVSKPVSCIYIGRCTGVIVACVSGGGVVLDTG